MPLPVIADVYRVRLKWESSSGQRPAVHQFNMRDIPGTQDENTLATELQANFTGNMWKVVSNSASIREIGIIKLDGVSAGKIYTPPVIGAGTISGGGGADPILQGACVVSLKSALRGPRYRNRMYLPFIGETNQAGGLLTLADVATMQTAWVAFWVAMNSAGWEFTVVANNNTSAPLEDLVVRPYLKTQRRRARR